MFMTDFYHVKMAGLNGGVEARNKNSDPVLLRKKIIQKKL
jgi:hypothetical protein